MALTKLITPRAASTWTLLLALSLLGPGLGGGGRDGTVLGLVVLALATIKIRLVGLDFMELRHAPTPMRAGFEAYCVLLWVTLSALYAWA
ncbi:MAG: cytochrome C oxidase subunit IV family protein [Pseudomonas sp.]